MTTKNYFISFSFVCILLFGSCKKENKNESENIDSLFFVINNQNSKSYFHKVYDPALLILDSIITYKADSIDLDNDGRKDIRFESLFNNSKYGYAKTAQIVILNDKLQIATKFYPDTTYYCSYELGDTQYNWYYHYYPCPCLNNSAINTLNTGQNFPGAMESGDTIYFSDSENLTWKLTSYGNAFTLYTKDSLLSGLGGNNPKLRYYFEYYQAGIWNRIGQKYLAFKIENNNHIKYGWIRFEVIEFSIIKIYEFECFIKESMAATNTVYKPEG